MKRSVVLVAFNMLMVLAMLTGCGGSGGGNNNTERDTTAPTVSSTSPSDGTTSVAVYSAVILTFSEEMDPATITTATVTLEDADSDTVAGSVTSSGTTATFTPAENLESNTTFTLSVSTGAEDLAGNGLESAYSFSFTTEPIRVLYLGDDADNTEAIFDYLVDEGFEVTDASPFSDWDGVTPAVTDFDVVVYLETDDYGYGLIPEGDAALTAWMLAGGTVIRSEWIAYSIGTGVALETDFDQYLPVEAPDSDYEYSTTWNVSLTDHPLVAGLPASWTNVDGGCSIVNAMADTVVVATTDLCGPALTILEHGTAGGQVIHINDDFGRDEGAVPDVNALVLLANAVRFGMQ
jgi:hypothetical protein